MSQLALTLGGYDVSDDTTKIDPTGFKITDLTKLQPSDIINALIPTLFVIAGLVLFGMLIGGGFTIFLSTGNPEKIKQGTGMITNALVGFLIMFAAYWIIQLVEFSLGVKLIWLYPNT